MRKYTVAHLFLTITAVLASTPFRKYGRQGAISIVSQPAAASSTAAQSSAVPTTPTDAPPSSTPVTTSAAATTASAPPPTTATKATTSAVSLTTASTASSSSATTAPTSSTSAISSPTSSASSPSSTQVVTSASVSTDAQGSQTTIIVTSTPSPASSSASPSATSTAQDNSVHASTIIGLSVAGGIAALAIVGFIVWKVTRKRFADLDDPDGEPPVSENKVLGTLPPSEAIKWPELNREHTNNDEGLSRQLSNPYSTNAPSRNASTLDQTEFVDPYAVPPLPQFNPNQPYRDDPYTAPNAGYYDPYRGPVPQTFQEGSVDGHENIAMSTYPPGTRSRSPGPGAAYVMGGRGSPVPGRASPALGQTAYDTGGRGSPAPGRTISPGPAAALGLDRRPSPAVQTAYSGPPEMAVRN